MASSYTTNKSIEKPAYNDYASNPTGWTTPVNNDWDIIDAAFGGVTNLTNPSTTVTLTSTQYQKLILNITGTHSGSPNYRIPSGVGGQWIVRNATSGAVTISSVGGGTNVSVASNTVDTVFSDGTNIRSAKTITIDPFPSGAIVMWSGSIATIPAGWFLCDGNNSTPDLRNRFVVGAGSTYSVAATGGSANATLVSHTHTATVTDTGHTHNTTISNANSGGATAAYIIGINNGGTTTWASSSAQTGISVSNSTEGSSATNANLPPYYALAYIMKA